MPSRATCSITKCGRKVRGKRLCYAHLYRLRKYGDPIAGEPIRLLRPRGMCTPEEVFRHFMPGDPPVEGCWEWTSSRSGAGYGRLEFEGKILGAHIVAYAIYHGSVPKGMVVRHDPALCNNPLCVHPDHLLIGTPADNEADKVIAGTSNQGTRNPQAKLTENDVREIRRVENRTKQELAIDYGVHPGTISRILSGALWSHIE